MSAIITHLAEYFQSAGFAALFLDALLKSLLVLALAGGVCAAWQRVSAATRHLIWFLAVVSLPFLPLLNITHPGWQKPVWRISSASVSGNQISLALELPGKQSAPVAQNPQEVSSGSPSSASTANAPAVTTHFNAHWMLMGWLMWFAGAALTLIWMGAGQFYRSEYSRAAKSLTDTGWMRLLNEAREALHWRRRVALLLSADEVMPMTWGWLRPVVLLPRSAAQWPEERRRVVLLHELAHVKRGDYFTQMAAQVVCAIYWFNPLVWVAARQMRIEREGACDDLVLTGGCKASEYAGHLVDIAGSFRRVPQMAAIAMARSSRLEGRIAAIVDGSRNRRLRLAAAMGVLALIGGIAVSIGGTGAGDTGSGKVDRLRQQQIDRLKAFSKGKEKQSEMLAAATDEIISPEFHHFFDAAKSGDWQTATNMYESFKQRHRQYSHEHQPSDLSLDTSYWGPVLEISLAYDHVVRCEPAYTQMAVDDIINSIPSGSIYFGGTDPGRGLPTAFCKSQVDADPFYTLTQNALADSTYLDYLDRTYGKQRPLLKQMAEACHRDSELQEINAGISKFEMDRTNKLDQSKLELATSEALLAEEEKRGDSEIVRTNISDLERTIKLQQNNVDYFENLSGGANESRDKRVKEILAEVQARGGTSETKLKPETIYIPTSEDSQRCFSEYYEDVTKRLDNNQLKPGEDVHRDAEGRLEVAGQTAVMDINGRLVKTIFDKNPGHEFYIEESFPLDWMYPYLEPHGLIMKINREPLSDITDAMVRQDAEFWQPRVTRMIGDWLKEDTSVADVTSFDEKVFLNHDLAGFTGDAGFVQNDYACRSFSKWRSAIAGLYAWRADHATNNAEKERMARAADFAFRQAIALCPYAANGTASRYADFLKDQNRDTDAALVEKIVDEFKPASHAESAPRKSSVFQVRLVLDAAATNGEPMRLESRNGDSTSVETVYVGKEVLLNQTAIESATFDKNRFGYPEIEISMTDSGGKQFAKITKEHINQRLAIVIDGKLLMAPVIHMPITEGKAKISGVFSDDEGKDLVAKINGVAKL